MTSVCPHPVGMRTRRDPKKMQKLFARRRRLGLTWNELAEDSGVPRTTLLYWDRRLRQEEPEETGRFVELVMSEAAPLTAALRGGRRVLVPVEFDADHLRRVVEALESEC